MEAEIKVQQVLFELVSKRENGKTICPSEVARAIDKEKWREHMPAIHAIVMSLVEKGKIEILQKNRPIDHRQLRGPYRIRRKY